jgi:hypothetical protein
VVLEDELQGIAMEERRLAQKYLREAQDLSQKGRNLIQTMDGMSKQLDDLRASLSSSKQADQAVVDAHKKVKDKLDSIRSVYFVSPPGQTGYRRPLLTAFRGGTTAELVNGIAGSFSGMGAPTQTAIDLLNDLRAFLEPQLAKMKEIQDKDADLNKLLAARDPYGHERVGGSGLSLSDFLE